ncbi:MAG: hypothetical protein JW715_14625 [Sedimentisphaerales bacterium]|nr:hypothetical protein [Sedimentisphaerales bacterium]
MKKINLILAFIIFTSGAAAFADEAVVAEVTHTQLQAVTQDGYGTYAAGDKVTISGILLNAPEQILDPTPGSGDMGGEWQVYIQGEGDDHAGTALWLGQYYSKVSSSDDYKDEELLSELCRINRDPSTGYIFNVGDRIRVTGWYKFYKGKTNINEKHEKDSFFDFKIELIKPAAGLPQPEVVKLDELKDINDEYIFDAERLSGCEYYQSRLIRIENVEVIDPENWGSNGTITVMDSNGHTFPVRLGLGAGFTRYDCPAGKIDVVGIMDQESSGYLVCKDGYRLWVANYDGNSLVLTDRGYKRGNLTGDVNGNFKIDLDDVSEIIENWLKSVPGLCDCY